MINETNPNDQVSSLLVVLLSGAQAGGMSEERAEAIYEDIVGHYANVDEEARGVSLAKALIIQCARVIIPPRKKTKKKKGKTK